MNIENVLSLFDGMSCGRVALHKAWINVGNYYTAEIDKYAVKVADSNHPQDTKNRLGDVTKWREWDINWSSIGLVFAGFPCQAWSIAGKQLGDKDERGMLFWTMLDIIKHINKERHKAWKPKVKFLIENVKMKKDFEKYITHHTEQALGYVEKTLINSALVSAQNRKRFYWTNWEVSQPEDKGIVLKDILLNKVADKYYHTDVAIKYMNRISKKGRRKWDFGFHSEDRKDKSACLTANFFKGIPNNVLVCGRQVGRKINPKTGKRDDYNKELKAQQRFEARYDKKSGTLTTVQKDNLLGVVDFPVSVRKFHPIECERLQTLPDNYTTNVSNTQRYKMIGNGWNVDTIVHILNHLHKLT